MKSVIDQESWLVSVGLFAAWIVTSIIAIFDGLYLREAILSIARLLQAEEYNAFRARGGIGLDFQTGYMVSFFDNVLLLVLAVAIVAVVIAIEYYYRKGRPQGFLLKRIGIVFGVEVALIVVCIIIRETIGAI